MGATIGVSESRFNGMTQKSPNAVRRPGFFY